MTDHTPLTDAELVELRKMLVCSAFGWPVGELEEAVRRYDAVVAEIRRLREINKRSCEDWAYDDDKIIELCKPYLTELELHGNSYGVPGIVEKVESLIRRLREELESKRIQWKACSGDLKMERPPINVTCPCCERDDKCSDDCGLHEGASDEWEELEWRRSIARYLDIVEVNAKPAKGK